MADSSYGFGGHVCITAEMAEGMRQANFDYLPPRPATFTVTEGESRPLTREMLELARDTMRQLQERGGRFAIASTPRHRNWFLDSTAGQPIKPPDPAERERALNLLETVLDKDAVETRGQFVTATIQAGMYQYKLIEGGFTTRNILVKRLGGESLWQEFRCYDIGEQYHPIDKMVAEILLIQTDEKRYLRESNSVGMMPGA